MNIGEKIKKRRIELELSLEDIGKEVGVARSTVGRWENGEIENMKRDKIMLLAKALKVAPSFIMGMDDDEDNTMYDIIHDGKAFQFKERKGNILMLMGDPGKPETFKEYHFDDYEQQEFMKIVNMNLLFFTGKPVSETDKLELERALLKIFIKAYFKRNK